MTRTSVGIACGVIAGAVYALSPLTMVSLAVIATVTVWAGRDLTPSERRWLYSLVLVAVAVRLLAVSALFMSSSPEKPFAVFFGDELFFKSRSLWMRNIGLRVPISPADLIYAYDDVGATSYLSLMALLQAMFGKAPYGIHVFNMACYLSSALLLFRAVQRAFGRVASLGGLAVLLFTPSLFMWSISALKEPTFTLAACGEVLCALQAARSRSWPARLLWFSGVIAGAVALESVRRGGGLVAIGGVAGGYLFGYVLPRPKWLLATAALLPIVCVATLAVPRIQQRVLTELRTAAFYHSGHVLSDGYSYRALDGEYYRDGLRIFKMPVRDVIAYVLRCYVAYVTEPLPWHVESRALLAYLPEQMFWLTLLVLAAVGVYAGSSRDPMMTMLLVMHAFAAASLVAMPSGNIGTLIRHRGLVMSYVAWLAGLGLYELVRRAIGPRTPSPLLTEGLHSHGRS